MHDRPEDVVPDPGVEAGRGSNHLVITVHGIRTYGDWQRDLKGLLEAAEPGVTVLNYQYGYFQVSSGGHGSGSTLTVPFGASALLSGRLTTAAGAGLGGRAIKVVTRPSRGALRQSAIERVRTGKRGGFVLRLGPGTSRRLNVSFPGTRRLAPSEPRPLDLRVRSGLTLSAAPKTLHTGDSVSLTGRVRSRGAPIPRRGKLVAIQYLEADTGRWRPALVTRTDHAGRFHARYRFRYVSGTAHIRLRATALAEEHWPYAPGSSSPVTVEVSG